MNSIYTTRVTSTGGRDGRAISEDKALDVSLSIPKELGGDGAAGTNPEQLFAAGYSACFIGALKFVAPQYEVSIPKDIKVSAIVGIGEKPSGVGFIIEVELEVDIPSFDKGLVKKLCDSAHQICPYSNATQGNIRAVTTIK